MTGSKCSFIYGLKHDLFSNFSEYLSFRSTERRKRGPLKGGSLYEGEIRRLGERESWEGRLKLFQCQAKT